MKKYYKSTFTFLLLLNFFISNAQIGFEEQIVSSDVIKPASVFAADIDGDGDTDVVSANDESISWYKNIGGQNMFDSQIIISTNVDAGNSIFVVDIDSDGDLDLVTSSQFDSKIAWYENINGLGTFGVQQIISTDNANPVSVFATDLDGDGDNDVLSAGLGGDVIAWHENLDGQGSFGAYQIIGSTDGATSVCASDIDNDGDMDVLFTSIGDDILAWYENTNGQGNFGPQQIISTPNPNGTSNFWDVKTADLDGDGDMDVIATVNPLVIWHENLDGLGTFGTQQEITTLTLDPRSVFAADLDEDNDLDVISASRSDDKIAWYENTNGQGNFGPQQILSTDADNTTSVFASDIDADGDMDILFSAYLDNKIAWFKNLGLLGNEINGQVKLDVDSNSCDDNDLPLSNVMIVSDNGNDSFATLTQSDGTYQMPVNEGDFITAITAQLPNYYSPTPNSHSSNFVGLGNTFQADFCLEPTGVVNDLNISIYPLNQARPGFDVDYRIVYKNIGTTQLNGNVTFEFDNSRMQFLSANETISSQTSNSLIFNYSTMNPFETRAIDLSFNIFPPPTTNIDDLLNFTASINPISSDQTVEDNQFVFSQTVIGSYDPNDIRVLEGEQILIQDIDKYLHYIIRFQNTGTASAINVRVNNLLDEKLDFTTLQLEDLSHNARVEITNGTDMDFIFNNIHLPDSTSNEPDSHGFIAYKVKPKSDVVLGDIFYNTADIYFDFNPPITTNTVTTEIVETLTLEENEIQKIIIYPNPTNDLFNIQLKKNTELESVSIYNLLGHLVLISKKSTVDISSLSDGLYFLEIKTNKGKGLKKLIKR